MTTRHSTAIHRRDRLLGSGLLGGVVHAQVAASPDEGAARLNDLRQRIDAQIAHARLAEEIPGRAGGQPRRDAARSRQRGAGRAARRRCAGVPAPRSRRWPRRRRRWAARLPMAVGGPRSRRSSSSPACSRPRAAYILEPSLQYAYSSSNRVSLVGYTVIPDDSHRCDRHSGGPPHDPDRRADRTLRDQQPPRGGSQGSVRLPQRQRASVASSCRARRPIRRFSTRPARGSATSN